MKKIIFFIFFFSLFLFLPRCSVSASYLPVKIPEEYLQPVNTVYGTYNVTLDNFYLQAHYGTYPDEYTTGASLQGYVLYGCVSNNHNYPDRQFLPVMWYDRNTQRNNHFKFRAGFHMDDSYSSFCRKIAEYKLSTKQWTKTAYGDFFPSLYCGNKVTPDKRVPITQQLWNVQGKVYLYNNITDPATCKILGDDWSLGWGRTLVYISNAEYPTPPSQEVYYYKLRVQSASKKLPDYYIYITSKKKCVVDLTGSTADKSIICENPKDVKIRDLYNNIWTQGGTNDYKLYMPDTNNPCQYLISSTYDLRDTEGNLLCKHTENPLVDEISSAFTPPVTFDPEAHDWGAFNWFKTVVSFFADMINGVAEWFYNLWRGFLDLIIPHPESLSRFGEDLKQEVDTKFSNIDISSLESLKNINENELQDVYITWRGQQVPLIKYGWVKENISILRTVLVGGLGLFLILFNVNQINKLLSDEEIT